MSGIRIPRLIALLLAGDAAIAAAYPLSVWLLDWRKGGVTWKLGTFVDLAGQRAVLDWYLSAQLFVIALLLAVLASHRVARRSPGSWLCVLPPLLFAALSLEAAIDLRGWLAFKAAKLPSGLLTRDTFYGRDLLVIALLVGGGPALAVVRWLRRDWTAVRPAMIKGMLGAACFAAALVTTGAPNGSPGLRVLELSTGALAEMLGVTAMLWGSLDFLHAYSLAPLTPRTAAPAPAGPVRPVAGFEHVSGSSPGGHPAAGPAPQA